MRRQKGSPVFYRLCKSRFLHPKSLHGCPVNTEYISVTIPTILVRVWGQELAVVEAMKMENRYAIPARSICADEPGG